MSRSFHHVECQGERLAATLDSGENSAGLLIVSGGNEIRSGAHAGMSRLAANLARQGYPVLRYDRRGIGESSGRNAGFTSTRDDLAAAIEFFTAAQPQLERVVTFGNCDAATALALFADQEIIAAHILANPWIIETEEAGSEAAPTLTPAAIRARYWERIKNPRSIIDLLTGKIDLRKLVKGAGQAAQKQEQSNLSRALCDALEALDRPCRILLASRDRTALAFKADWDSKAYAAARENAQVVLHTLDSASHSFADREAKAWLHDQIIEVMEKA